MPTVLASPTRAEEDTEPYSRLLRENGLEVRLIDDFLFARGRTSDEHVIETMQGVSAIIAGGTRFNPHVLENLPDLRVISRSGVGFDMINVPAATANGVVLTITPSANYEAVAEHAFTLVVAMAKTLFSGDRSMRAGEWASIPRTPLRGSTLGIVGLGRIGKALATRALAMKMRIVATEKYPDEAFVRENGIELMELETLLRSADFVSLHCPLNDETRGLMNSKTLALMKPEACLVNTARGGLIVEADLVEALRSGQIANAGIDVFEPEPTEPDNPLFELDNVILSPHIAGVDTMSMKAMRMDAAANIASLYKGEWPDGSVVNDELKGKWTW